MRKLGPFAKSIIICLFLLPLSARAEWWSEGGSTNFFNGHVTARLGWGTGTMSIANPDASYAYYSISAMRGALTYSFFGSEKDLAEIGAIGSGFVSAFTNSVRVNTETETGFQIGPGLGLYVRFWKFFVDFGQDYIIARHTTTGRELHTLDYNMAVARVSYGFGFGITDRLGFLITSAIGSGLVPKEQSKLSSDSQFLDQTYMFSFTYLLP